MNRLAIVILLAALVSPVLAAFPDRLPNQPGVLSAEDIKAATEAMKVKLGTGPALELVASGNQASGSSFAVFATPFATFSDRGNARKRTFCSRRAGESDWQCMVLHDEIQITANGVDHDFLSVHVPPGPGDVQLSANIADFMYSQCFIEQLKAKGAPSYDAISITMVEGLSGELNVTVGTSIASDRYKLEKTDKKSDGCGFRIVSFQNKKAVAEKQAARQRAAGNRMAQERELKEKAAREERPGSVFEAFIWLVVMMFIVGVGAFVAGAVALAALRRKRKSGN